MSAELLGERLARQGFADRPCPDVASAAAHTVGIQAQDPRASRLGVRTRSALVTESDVVAAIADTRSVTRTWLMRGTIHLVDTVDLRWLVRLIGPSIRARYAKRWTDIGLVPELLDRVVDLLPAVLADRPLTRREIATSLAEHGVNVPETDPQAATHLIVHASTLGLVCRGHDQGRDATFTLLDDWVPRSPAGPSGDDALAELARRYFRAFSPATAADFTTWSGFGSGRALSLIRDELTPTDVDGRPGFRLGEVEPARAVRLVAGFDNYLVGYRHRDAILSAELRPRVYEGGVIRPSVLVDGRIVGTWRLELAAKRTRVEVTPFECLPKRVSAELERETADLARFLARDLTMQLES